jgi:hypothetical protein
MKATIVRADWESDQAWLRVSWSELRKRTTWTIGDVVELTVAYETNQYPDWTCPTCGETMPANCLGCGPGVHHTCMEFPETVSYNGKEIPLDKAEKLLKRDYEIVQGEYGNCETCPLSCDCGWKEMEPTPQTTDHTSTVEN